MLRAYIDAYFKNVTSIVFGRRAHLEVVDPRRRHRLCPQAELLRPAIQVLHAWEGKLNKA